MIAPIPMVGRTYGQLRVLRDLPYRIAPCGARIRYVLVRCSCGREYEGHAASIRAGRATRCLECAKDEARRRRGDRSVRLSDGRTVAEIAADSGLKLHTVWRRHARGWPDWRLGVSLCHRGRS